MRKYTVLIDSRDRDYKNYPDPGEYRVWFPREYKNVASARLLTLEMPSSFYVFTANSQNVSLRVGVYDGTGTSIDAEYSVNIPDGNYTAEEMAVALKKTLTTAFSALGLTFQTQIDPTTLKLSITTVESRVLKLDGTYGASDAPTQWGLAYYLGFDRTVYHGTILTSPRLVSVNPYTYILLDIKELNAVEEMGLYGDGTTGQGAFAKIPFAVNSFQYVSLDNSASQNSVSLFPPLPKLHHIRIKFRFHDGRIVNFNNVEHSFSLELTCIEPANTNDTPKTAPHSMIQKVQQRVPAKPPPHQIALLNPPPPPTPRWPWVFAGIIALIFAFSRGIFFTA